MNYRRLVGPFFIVTILVFNLLSLFIFPDELTRLKFATSTFSQGDRYFAKLSLWYYFAKRGDWQTANRLESQLDPADLLSYKQTHHPSELKKYLNELTIKPQKTIEDWVELARIQNIIGKTADSKDALGRAYSLDPIRDDISQIYYQQIR